MKKKSWNYIFFAKVFSIIRENYILFSFELRENYLKTTKAEGKFRENWNTMLLWTLIVVLLWDMWLYINISKYPWKCLNKMFWLCQGFEYTWSSYLFDKLWKMTRALIVSEFCIWQGCICKGYTEFWIWLNMVHYASKNPEYGSICLNVPQHA